ncbi:MAG TPA: O-methyltransferase [Candidatus Saccharimonadales bacterium]|nr:O-methyltransferase [Candidatus Saccharimonadales bacterium]
MTKKIKNQRKSLNFLAQTTLGKIINKAICRIYLWAHWDNIDTYYEDLLHGSDEVLKRALRNSQKSGLPIMNVSAAQGKFLQLLTMAVKAKRVLEIGTLGGYSTIWLARGLQKNGSLTTLEYNPDFAKVAEKNIKDAGFSKYVTIRVGLAMDSLKQMEKEGVKPFDLIFIDADKNNYPGYLTYALKFSHPGTVIIGDNVVREEDITDKKNTDPDNIGIRQFIELLGSKAKINATVMQTVGSKGHDGFSFAIVS